MSFDVKLAHLVARHTQLRDTLSQGAFSDPQEFARLSKEYSDLSPVVEKIEEYQKLEQEKLDLEAMLKDTTDDPEMKKMVESDLESVTQKSPQLLQEIKILLLPKDEADEKNAILEIRAGTGGEEAALFGADLFRMYQRYADLHGWKFEILEVSDTGIGGIKEASASIIGRNVFARLKYESGVHRVQRVPETEAGGRIHTSAATVAVLPEAEEVDIQIEEKDIRIDVFRSSGPGGQSVNTTDSAVRITHLPTGIVVQQQDEKSQHKNKAKALKILRARIYDAEREKLANERSASRKSQVGSGDRSERIRTYNFPQGRVTDHRINLTLYKLDRVLDGSALDELIDVLTTEDQAERLAHLGDNA